MVNTKVKLQNIVRMKQASDDQCQNDFSKFLQSNETNNRYNNPVWSKDTLSPQPISKEGKSPSQIYGLGWDFLQLEKTASFC